MQSSAKIIEGYNRRELLELLEYYKDHYKYLHAHTRRHAR